MSGGHFNNNNYIYYQVFHFADELEINIENNHTLDEYGCSYKFSEEVINCLKKYVPEIRKIADFMRAADYLYSGDYGEEFFLKKINAIEEGSSKDKSNNE